MMQQTQERDGRGDFLNHGQLQNIEIKRGGRRAG